MSNKQNDKPIDVVFDKKSYTEAEKLEILLAFKNPDYLKTYGDLATLEPNVGNVFQTCLPESNDEDLPQFLSRVSDNMRFVLDLVCTMTDSRNSDKVRLDAAYDLMDRDYLYKVVSETRELFREIANQRTDEATPKER